MNVKNECFYNIAEEFSRFPGGRLSKDGPYSGEQFRDDVLIPLFEQCSVLKVDLTGTVCYTSSFLDESFGELGKRFGYEMVREKLTLISNDDPLIIDTIWEKVRIAARENRS